MIFWSAQKQHRNTFYPPSIPFPRYFLRLQQWWHLYCFTILGSTSIVIHSGKQSLLRNRPRSDAAPSCGFSYERLWRSFTHANRLHWTAQQSAQNLILKKSEAGTKPSAIACSSCPSALWLCSIMHSLAFKNLHHWLFLGHSCRITNLCLVFIILGINIVTVVVIIVGIVIGRVNIMFISCGWRWLLLLLPVLL